MADVTPLRINLQAEEVAYRSSVSEATLSRVGSSVNFINYYQFKHFEFGYLRAQSTLGSPTYNQFTPPATISNLEVFPSGSQIVAIILQHNVSGSGGTSELDIQWSTQNSGSWASIFSTTPKATSSAPADSQWDTTLSNTTNLYTSIATTPIGCTVPIMSKTTFNAGDRLRCRAVSHQTGNPNGFSMQIYYRPF